MHTITVSDAEFSALLDALQKGASRHEAFARFNPQGKSVRKHELTAAIQRGLQRKLQARINVK